MGTDGAWRWRKGVEDKYHYRFWGQVVRWMAYQRNMAKGETMRLYYSPDQPQIDGTLTLSANVMNRNGEPLQGGDVTARITAPSGKAETIGFASSGDPWGAYSCAVCGPRAGKTSGHSRVQANRRKLGSVFLCAGRRYRACWPARTAGSAGGDRAGDAGQSDASGPAG